MTAFRLHHTESHCAFWSTLNRFIERNIFSSLFQDQIDGCDAFLVIYSVVDKASFTRAEYFLSLLQDMDLLRSRCCILVGNKIDLARSRAISSQGESCHNIIKASRQMNRKPKYVSPDYSLHRWKMLGLYISRQIRGGIRRDQS